MLFISEVPAVNRFSSAATPAIAMLWLASLLPISISASVTSSPAPPQISQGGGTNGTVGDLACRPCHPSQFAAYLLTAHHRTSSLPDATSIAGSFANGRNGLTTFNPEVRFVMEARNGHFYQTAIRQKNGHITKRTEQIDLVIGSATKGQTYLYWRQNELFELPVSYWTAFRSWVNSPGYVDGSADFDRPVLPRCLECHATYIHPLTSTPSEHRYDRDSAVLGISCERCHGPGLDHVTGHSTDSAGPSSQHAMAPAGLSRDQQIEVCAECHGGAGEPVAPAFSFTPGKSLAEHIKLKEAKASDRLDVHGNQVLLLERSRCFQASPTMSCSTCHDVHKPERPAAQYSARCLTCHRVSECGLFPKAGAAIASNCIDCHMPVQQSNTLVLDAEDTRVQASIRNHWIRVYRNPSGKPQGKEEVPIR